MTNYRQLCAELLAWAEKTSGHYYKQPDVIQRARAALAEPEPDGPTDDQLHEIWETGHLPSPEEMANNNGEKDLDFLFTSAYINWLDENPEAREEHELKCLRAVFNAGRRWGQPL